MGEVFLGLMLVGLAIVVLVCGPIALIVALVAMARTRGLSEELRMLRERSSALQLRQTVSDLKDEGKMPDKAPAAPVVAVKSEPVVTVSETPRPQPAVQVPEPFKPAVHAPVTPIWTSSPVRQPQPPPTQPPKVQAPSGAHSKRP